MTTQYTGSFVSRFSLPQITESVTDMLRGDPREPRLTVESVARLVFDHMAASLPSLYSRLREDGIVQFDPTYTDAGRLSCALDVAADFDWLGYADTALGSGARIAERTALNLIHDALSGQEWSADTLDRVADVLRHAGYDMDETDAAREFVVEVTETARYQVTVEAETAAEAEGFALEAVIEGRRRVVPMGEPQRTTEIIEGK